MNIEKAKKDKKFFALLGAGAFAAAVISAVIVIILVLKQNYLPMWFLLAISAAGFYATPFLGFAAVDRNSVIILLRAADELGANSVSDIAARLGWKENATEKFIKKCVKWGYIKSADKADESTNDAE